MWENDAEFVWAMLDSGAAKAVLRDEDGELVFDWDHDVLEEKFPEVYSALQELIEEETQKTLDDLILKGFIEVQPVIGEDGEIKEDYELTDLGREVFGDIDKED
jgi:hypothetical protein